MNENHKTLHYTKLPDFRAGEAEEEADDQGVPEGTPREQTTTTTKTSAEIWKFGGP